MSEPVKVTNHAHQHWTGRCGRINEPRRALIEAVYRSREAEPHEIRAADRHFKTGDRASLHYRIDEETGILLAIFTNDDEDIWHIVSCQIAQAILAEYHSWRRTLKRALKWKRKCAKTRRLTEAEHWWRIEGRAPGES